MNSKVKVRNVPKSDNPGERMKRSKAIFKLFNPNTSESH
jgi:hypothetical protein